MTRWRSLAGVVTLLALGIGITAWRFRLLSPRPLAAQVAADIAMLTIERDALRARLWFSSETRGPFAGHPQGDVLIGVPTSFVRSIINDAATGWFNEIDLHIVNVVIHTQDSVFATIGPFGEHKVGWYTLAMHLDDIRGRIMPGLPQLTFGGDAIKIALPVMAEGKGSATLHFTWTSKGVARPVCGNLKAVRTVSGRLRPDTAVVRGLVRLSAKEGALEADPHFPNLAIKMRIVPSPASVAAIDTVIHSPGGLCGVFVRRAHAFTQVIDIVQNGFIVHIPQRFFRPLRLPVAVETSVPVQGNALRLAVRPSGLVINPSMIWLGAAVTAAPRDTVHDHRRATARARAKRG